MSYAREQAGLALLSAMMLIGIIASVLAVITHYTAQSFDYTNKFIAAEQSLQYIKATHDWAEKLLKEDDNESDSYHDNWAQQLPLTEVKGGYIEASINDYSSKFNINNILIMGSGQQAVFSRLLHNLDMSVPVENFLNKRNVDGRYFTSYRDFIDNGILSEKEAIKLNKYVSFYPGVMLVNVNTASKKVLQAVLPNVSSYLIDQLILERKEKPISSLSGYDNMSGTFVTTVSNLFELSVQLKVYDVVTRQKIIISREQGEVYIVRKYGGSRG